MKIVNGKTKDLWKSQSSISLLKEALNDLEYGEIVEILKSEWEWKTEPHRMVYQMCWRRWIDYTVSCRSTQEAWYLKKKKSYKSLIRNKQK